MSQEKEQFTGEKLKELRKKYGLTQVELGEELNIQQEMISRWETTNTISKVYRNILKNFFNRIEKR
jgi:transcriptional regulator with XRE-family HTH domain